MFYVFYEYIYDSFANAETILTHVIIFNVHIFQFGTMKNFTMNICPIRKVMNISRSIMVFNEVDYSKIYGIRCDVIVLGSIKSFFLVRINEIFSKAFQISNFCCNKCLVMKYKNGQGVAPKLPYLNWSLHNNEVKK